MSQKMTDNDWCTFLKDLDHLEHTCKLGYMGSFHVDFPYIANLDELEAAKFYLKKEALYQGKVFNMTRNNHPKRTWKLFAEVAANWLNVG